MRASQWYDITNPPRIFYARTVDEKVCIGDKSLRNYMPKYIKTTSNKNKISCGYKTCIRAILLPSDLNKWMSSQLAKIDKLYTNYASTRLLKDLRSISLNIIIKYFQIIHIYI